MTQLFIELTDAGGTNMPKPTLLGLAHIQRVVPAATGGAIVELDDGTKVRVVEVYEDIRDMLLPSPRDAPGEAPGEEGTIPRPQAPSRSGPLPGPPGAKLKGKVR